MSNLKPCPFCGGEAKLDTAWGLTFQNPSHVVRCCVCGASGETSLDRPGAVDNWNCRFTDGALSRLLSAAREIRDIEREGGGSMDRVDEYRDRWEAAISALCEALEEVEA